MFILHGSLLAGFVVSYALWITSNSLAIHAKSVNSLYIVASVADILATVTDLLELLTFYLVIFLMLPLSTNMRNKRKEFNTFLHRGFVDFDHLESAVIAQNPEMT